MVVIVLPGWYTKAEKKLQEVIDKIARENDIPLDFVEDSLTIENSQKSILHSLVNIDENCRVEERERLKKFAKEMKGAEKQMKGAEKPTEAKA